jgi:hypothetical protein
MTSRPKLDGVDLLSDCLALERPRYRVVDSSFSSVETFPTERQLWWCGLWIYHGVNRSHICDCSHCKSYSLVLPLRNAIRFFPLMRSIFLPRLYRFVCVPMSTQPFMVSMRRTAVS